MWPMSAVPVLRAPVLNYKLLIDLSPDFSSRWSRQIPCGWGSCLLHLVFLCVCFSYRRVSGTRYPRVGEGSCSICSPHFRGQKNVTILQCLAPNFVSLLRGGSGRFLSSFWLSPILCYCVISTPTPSPNSALSVVPLTCVAHCTMM